MKKEGRVFTGSKLGGERLKKKGERAGLRRRRMKTRKRGHKGKKKLVDSQHDYGHSGISKQTGLGWTEPETTHVQNPEESKMERAGGGDPFKKVWRAS